MRLFYNKVADLLRPRLGGRPNKWPFRDLDCRNRCLDDCIMNRQHGPWTANPVIVCSLRNTCRAIQQLSLDLVAHFVLIKG